jgi:hypothetical protein
MKRRHNSVVTSGWKREKATNISFLFLFFSLFFFFLLEISVFLYVLIFLCFFLKKAWLELIICLFSYLLDRKPENNQNIVGL